MKIAICFSGMIRTGIHAAPLIKKFIDDLYNDVDFFMHTWNISEDKRWHHNCLALRQGKIQNIIVENSYDILNKLYEVYDRKIVTTKVENFNLWNIFEEKYNYFSPQWYSWQESIKLKSEYEHKSNFKYDVVIKMRPDIIYPNYTDLKTEIENYKKNENIFYAIGGNYKRVDDVFFIASSDIMDRSSMFFSNTEDKKWIFDNFGKYLADINIERRATVNERYTVLRREALDKDINNFNVCFNIDRDYHAPYNTERLPE